MTTHEIFLADIDVRISQITTAKPEEMCMLYHAGGWCIDTWNVAMLQAVVEKSFAFVAAETKDGSWIGMGRLISDGVSDAYLHDIVVLPKWEGNGIGSGIVQILINICHEHGITWIGFIAEPQTEYFYRKFGFSRMNLYTPMIYERSTSHL